MDRDRANVTRLHINRIALIQQIDTDELIPKLIQMKIISSDNDVPYIKQGFSKIDRARRLIDCLINENIEHSHRPINWFLLFRSILLENPTAYTNLVNLLDQTIIEKFDSKKNIEIQDHHQITHIQFDRYVMNKISIEGNFHKVVDHLICHSEFPKQLLEQLSQSTHSYDRNQFEQERKIFDEMCQLELLMNFLKQDKTLTNQNIFNFEIFESFLNYRNHYHYFYKYFYSLSSIYGIYFDREFVQALKIALKNSDNLVKIIDKGFLFYHFLYNYGRYELCRELIESIIQTLTKQINKQNGNLWIYLFRSCCALVQVHNQSFEIKEAWARIDAANEIAEKLQTTGIEISNDDYAWLYFVSSQTAYEDANFDACIQYSYRGLRLANHDNHELIVDLLCSLSQGLISKWIMNKAQAAAVMAVQYAAQYCGRNSPKYISALQQLVQYSNEFIQDSSSIELAQYTINRARIIYGYESLMIAHCHRALSKSFITFTSIKHLQQIDSQNQHTNTIFNESSPSVYLHHAYEAYRIAQDWFGIEDRRRLFPFKMSLTNALQTRVAANIVENKSNYFNESMEHLKDCLAIAKDIFGVTSFKVAQVHRLQSATYLSKKMFIEAEKELNFSLQIYKLCLPLNSFHYLVTKASLGLLYKQQGNYRRALVLFQNIAQLLDTKTQSFRWINLVLENLIECYSHIESKNNDENSSRNKTEVEKIQSELDEWRRTNIKRPNLMNIIHQPLAYSLQQFLQNSTKFQQTTHRLHALLHTQQKAKNQMFTFASPTDTEQI